METVMRLVMCNWTWSHFAWEYSDPARLDFTCKSRQTSRTLFVQRLVFFWAGSADWGTLLRVSFFPNGYMSSRVAPFSYVPKTTINPRPHNPHTAFSQPTPPSLGLFCPLELSLCEEDKNTAPCEFMVPSELPLKIWTFQSFALKPK